MEGGRTIYFKGNTVAAPRPNDKNRRQRAVIAHSEHDGPDKVMDITPKVCATSQCVWCGNTFPEGVSLIVCMLCHTCQYCGLISHRNDACAYCGNILPDELKAVPAISDIVYSVKKRIRV